MSHRLIETLRTLTHRTGDLETNSLSYIAGKLLTHRTGDLEKH